MKASVSERERGPAPFVWPPKAGPLADTAHGQPAPEPALRPRSPLAEWLLTVERCWLAPTALPLELRAREAGWAPDEPGDYCPRCGETTGPHEADEFGCAACRDDRLPWSRFVRIGEYRGDLAGCVQEVKFTRWRRLGIDLGRTLGRQLIREGLRPAGRAGEPVAVVPIPSSFRRRLVRGIDHAATIARGVAEELDAPVVEALRARTRPSQRSVVPSQRKRNAARAFRPRRGVVLTGWTVVLVDDVRTSGATLRAAARALRPLGASSRAVWVATVAVTPREGDHPAGAAPEAGDVGSMWKT